MKILPKLNQVLKINSYSTCLINQIINEYTKKDPSKVLNDNGSVKFYRFPYINRTYFTHHHFTQTCFFLSEGMSTSPVF